MGFLGTVIGGSQTIIKRGAFMLVNQTEQNAIKAQFRGARDVLSSLALLPSSFLQVRNWLDLHSLIAIVILYSIYFELSKAYKSGQFGCPDCCFAMNMNWRTWRRHSRLNVNVRLQTWVWWKPLAVLQSTNNKGTGGMFQCRSSWSPIE